MRKLLKINSNTKVFIYVGGMQNYQKFPETLNFFNDLKKYDAIIPCGIKDKGITNLKQIKNQNYDDLENKLIEIFKTNLKNLIF